MPKKKVNNIVGDLHIFQIKLEKLVQFASIYYASLEKEDYNSIETEIQLASEYMEFIKIKTNDTNIYFHDERIFKNLDIVLPHHIINNFTKNAIEKGKRHGLPLSIAVADYYDAEVYCLEISDDGLGIGKNFSILTLDSESTGLRNVQRQIEYYNARDMNKYFIDFNDCSIKDRQTTEGSFGTTITLRIERKCV